MKEKHQSRKGGWPSHLTRQDLYGEQVNQRKKVDEPLIFFLRDQQNNTSSTVDMSDLDEVIDTWTDTASIIVLPVISKK